MQKEIESAVRIQEKEVVQFIGARRDNKKNQTYSGSHTQASHLDHRQFWVCVWLTEKFKPNVEKKKRIFP